MKNPTRFLCLGVFLSAILFVSPATADLFDNFDTYADTAAFEAVWTDSTGAGLSVNSTVSLSSPNSVWNPGYATAGAASRRQMAPIDALALDFSFDFYDGTVSDGRDYGQLYSRSGAWSNPTGNILRVGKYNTIVTPKYYGYIYLTSGVIPGDGASALASGYFALGGAANRSIGWHNARVTGEADPAHPGMALYKFYIDGVLGGSLANATDRDFDWVVLGSGLSSANGPIWFDNLQVTAIPEPSAVGLGLLGLAALVYRRQVQRRRT